MGTALSNFRNKFLANGRKKKMLDDPELEAIISNKGAFLNGFWKYSAKQTWREAKGVSDNVTCGPLNFFFHLKVQTRDCCSVYRESRAPSYSPWRYLMVHACGYFPRDEGRYESVERFRKPCVGYIDLFDGRILVCSSDPPWGVCIYEAQIRLRDNAKPWFIGSFNIVGQDFQPFMHNSELMGPKGEYYLQPGRGADEWISALMALMERKREQTFLPPLKAYLGDLFMLHPEIIQAISGREPRKKKSKSYEKVITPAILSSPLDDLKSLRAAIGAIEGCEGKNCEESKSMDF